MSSDLCTIYFRFTKGAYLYIHPSKIIERPKVIYNEKTKQFVMWLHIDNEDYAYARAGVADCVIEWKEKWKIW